MKLYKLIIRDLLGNGLKTWLSAFVLSVAFTLILFLQGMMEGWNRQAISDMRKWEIAGGQYWTSRYDPYDPFTLDSAAALVPEPFTPDIGSGRLEPVLIATGTLYPFGHSVAVQLKGIRPEQRLLVLPTHLLENPTDEETIPVIIGSGMARQTKLNKGDEAVLRWRDANGTFEARDVRIAGVFQTFVPAVDGGQLWVPLETLRQMMLKEGQATILIKSEELPVSEAEGWTFKSEEELTLPLHETIRTKVVGQSIFYIIFLLLGLLAVFDTQTLAIFRRQREIGTFIALGMTKKEVVRLFTVEGAVNAVLAILLGAVYGIPICAYFAVNGIPMPSGMDDFGIALADKIYPYFSPQLIFGAIVFVISITALVSYLPARKIAKMNPTDAIKGKAL